MELPKGFLEMIDTDIKKIDETIATGYSQQALLALHKEIDGKYQSCIANWYQGLNAMRCLPNGQLYLEYAYIDNCKEIIENLNMWKAKLEVYRYGMNATASPEVPTTNVNVTTNVNLSITFEQVRSQIEDMTSLTDEETKEIKAQIDKLEEIVNSKDKKKTKWEKAKSILIWLADKSFDVGMALLPLLLKIQG